jgi:DNA-binding response OmpR family regulator
MKNRRCVLLVDDEASVREALDRLFVSQQYDVVAVATGQEAMAKFGQGQIDLAVLDVTLATESGWETARELIALNPTLPVIVITARPDQTSLPLAKRVAAVMEKPLNLPVLLDTIKNLLAQPENAKRENAYRQVCGQLKSEHGLASS